MTENKRFELIPMCNKNDIWYGVFDNLEKEYVTDRLCGSYKNVFDKLNELNDENEQLTKELKVYRKLARCSNCEHHGYDWFDDGDEFEVCEKGNDVTERICEDWEEL